MRIMAKGRYGHVRTEIDLLCGRREVKDYFSMDYRDDREGQSLRKLGRETDLQKDSLILGEVS